MLAAIFGFLLASLTIRWLGEAEAGFVIALAAIAGINNTFSGFGLGTAAIRLISRANEEKNFQEIQKIAGVCFTTSLVFGLIGLCIFGFGSPWIVKWSQYEGNTGVASLYCLLLGLSFLFQQINSYFNIFLFSLQRYDLQTKLNTSYLLVNCVLGIILLSRFPYILTLGIIQAALCLLNCLSTGFAVFRLLGWIRPSWSQPTFTKLWSFGKWIYLTQITGTIANGLDKIILISVFGSSSLPLYTLSQRIYQTVHGILAGQSSYLFPMLSAKAEIIDTLSDQVEDKLRWFIGLLSGFMYSGLIIIGPVLLTILINPEFSSKAGFQLFIFCWVGYISALSVVPFFLILTKGDSKGTWIYHIIVGFSYLPFFIIFAYLFGFQYAVVGQLMIFCGTIYLHHRFKPKMKFIPLMAWLVKPLYSSFFLMCIASSIHLILIVAKASTITQFFASISFTILAVFLVPRLEVYCFGGLNRMKTLAKAVSFAFPRFVVARSLVIRLMGFKDL